MSRTLRGKAREHRRLRVKAHRGRAKWSNRNSACGKAPRLRTLNVEVS